MSHFGNFHNILAFLIIIIFVVVIFDVTTLTGVEVGGSQGLHPYKTANFFIFDLIFFKQSQIFIVFIIKV